jgi:hypothetical protein
MNSGNLVARRQRGDLFAAGEQERIDVDEQGATFWSTAEVNAASPRDPALFGFQSGNQSMKFRPAK